MINNNQRKRGKLSLIVIILIFISILLSGCAQFRDFLSTTKGDLIGQHFDISIYDNYANKTMSLNGTRISVEVFKGNKKLFKGEDSGADFDSSVLELTVNGDQVIQVGNTMIFEEDGLSMVENYETPTEITESGGIGLVPIDRYVNNIKNKIGKEKTIIIMTPRGVPIGVYEGKRVFVDVPDDLPKMTRLNIDGKSLYIHRANYVILDTKALD